MKSCGVIVTYNRKNLLIENLKSCLSQQMKLDKIYIIDNNSNDGTYEALEQERLLDDSYIKYIKLENNIGGAGGFYTGVYRAYEDGYDYIILMDDDGRPYDDECFKNLIDKANMLYLKNPKLMLNSIVICDEKKLSFGLGEVHYINELNHEELIEKINPFNGTLISKELIKEIGFPNKDFFIKGDEIEYRMRANRANAQIFTVVSSRYYHPEIPKKSVKLFFYKRIDIIDESPWKEYYRARNHTYINLKYNQKKKLIHHYLWQLKNILLSSKRIKKIYYFIIGIKDGIKGNLGAKVKP